MEIKLKTLTPLWTGGIETGRMDRLHETGLIGSLRWWYEAIVRGLGGDVCNPTSDNPADRCPRDDGSYCDVCQIFGATGLRRTFRIHMGSGASLFSDSLRSIPLPSGRIHSMRNNRLRAGGWYLMGESVMDDAVPLEIIPLSSVDFGTHLRLVLALIDRHAAIGAKVSNGYGVVSIWENKQRIQVTNEDSDALPQAQSPPPCPNTLPNIRDFFFAKVRFEEPTNNQNWWQQIRGIHGARTGKVSNGRQQINVHRNRQEHQQAKQYLDNIVKNGLLPMAPAVRNYLRFHWFPTLFSSGRARRQIENYLFGYTSSQNNMASKINVSHAYRLENGQWELRVWGWIPCRSPKGIFLNRDDFHGNLRCALEEVETWQWIFNADQPTPQVIEWHALACDQTDGMAYLKELLGLEEGGAS